MAITHSSTMRDALANAVVTAVGASGKFVIKDGGGAVLATLAMAVASFGAASGGTITAGTITTNNASGTGTATTFEVQTSGGTMVFKGTIGTAGSDVTITNTSINSGDPISVSSLTYSAPS